jgi:predicted dehydrogenase
VSILLDPDPTTFGLVGTGNISHYVGKNIPLHPKVQRFLVFDRDQSLAAKFAASNRGTVCSSIDELLSHRPKGLAIATGPASQPEIAANAIAAGTVETLFLEKPVALSLLEAMNIHRAAQERGVSVWVDFHQPLLAEYLLARIARGALGMPQVIKYTWRRQAPGPLRGENGAGRRLRPTEDLGSHGFAFAVALLGDALPESVRTKPHGDGLDVVTANFTNGATLVGTFEFDAPIVESEIVEVIVTGSRGEARVLLPTAFTPPEVDHRPLWVPRGGPGRRLPAVMPIAEGRQEGVFRWIEGSDLPFPLALALRVQAMDDAARRSLADGGECRVPAVPPS